MALAVEMKKLSGLSRQATITIPAEDYAKKVNTQLLSYKNQIRMPGFRKGHVPKSVLEKRFGAYARGEVAENIVRDTLYDALKEHDLQPVAQPEVQVSQQEDGQPFIYTAEFEQYPEIKVDGIDKLKIKVPTVELSDKDIDEGVEEILKQHIDWVEVDREAKKGDRLTIDFVGRRDGTQFPGGSGQQQQVVLGEGQMLEDFEKPLYDKRAGDTLEFPLTFPKDYNEELGGVKVGFAVKIHSVSEGQSPKIDQALFDKLELVDKSEAGLRAEVKSTLEKDVEARIAAIKQTRVREALRTKAKFDLPESFIRQEVERLVGQAPESERESLQKKDATDKKHPMAKQAQENVTDALVVNHLIDEHKLTVTEADLRAHVASLSMPFLENEQMQQYLLQNKEWVQGAQMQLLERQAYDKAAEQMQASDEKLTLTKLREKVDK